MSYQRTTQFTSARRQGNWNRNQNTVAFASNIKLGPVTHTVLVALMITVLGLIYLTQATRATGYDYQANKLNNQIAELNNQKEDLAVENARLSALTNIQDSSVASTLSTPSETNYAN